MERRLLPPMELQWRAMEHRLTVMQCRRRFMKQQLIPMKHHRWRAMMHRLRQPMEKNHRLMRHRRVIKKE